MRRAMDDAVEPVTETVEILEATEVFAEFEDRVKGIEVAAEIDDAGALSDRIKDLRSDLRGAEAGDDLMDALQDARRALRGSDPDPAEVREALSEARTAFDAELAWRRAAAEDVLPGLRAYLADVDDTLGLFQKQVIPEEVAREIVGCQSRHRDVSLQF